MIPEADEDGVLPTGEHEATMEEVQAYYCSNKCRELIFSGLVLLIAHLRSIGCRIIYIGGAFISGKSKPKFAVVWWEDGTHIEWDGETDIELLMESDPRFRQHMAYRAKVYPLSPLGGIASPLFKAVLLTNSETGRSGGIIKIKIAS